MPYLERQILKETAESKRLKGESLSNEICKNYRRDGLFFDEILDAAQKEKIVQKFTNRRRQK